MSSPVITMTWTKDGDQVVTNYTIAGGGQTLIIDEAIVAGTDTLVNCAIDISELLAIYILSSTDAQLEANAATGAAYTLTLKAGIPFVWILDSGITNPITADTTKFYVTNVADTQLTIRINQDATP